jgi:hypothetical protein
MSLGGGEVLMELVKTGWGGKKEKKNENMNKTNQKNETKSNKQNG